jgi:hypothetical protein
MLSPSKNIFVIIKKINKKFLCKSQQFMCAHIRKRYFVLLMKGKTRINFVLTRCGYFLHNQFVLRDSCPPAQQLGMAHMP